jgi:hypothetical protein
MEELQRQNDIMREQIDDHLLGIETKQATIHTLVDGTREEFENMSKWVQASLAYDIAMTEETRAGEAAARGLAGQWQNVRDQIASAKKELAGEQERINLLPLTKEYTAEDRAKALEDAKKAYDNTVQEIFNDASNKFGKNTSSSGVAATGAGMLFRNAGGKISGTGSRDSVSAMLTPGEFVVRKAMVNKYGMPMFNSINQGSFAMPKYNMGPATSGNVNVKTETSSNIVAPMYNNYSVNVSVSNTNASADEIANRTIMKIKQMNNMQIRGGRGY